MPFSNISDSLGSDVNLENQGEWTPPTEVKFSDESLAEGFFAQRKKAGDRVMFFESPAVKGEPKNFFVLHKPK